MSVNLQKLRKIIGKAFRKAKRWYLLYLGSQLVVLILAVTSILVQLSAYFTAVIVFLLVLTTELFRWRSDYWKAQGESAKRKWELVDGLGIPLDSKDIADWLASRPHAFLTDVTTDELQGSEFDSRRPQGVLRLIENTRESAWWSKHESRRVAVFLGIVVACVVVGALIALLASIATLKTPPVEQSGALVRNIAGIVCSVLVFVFSINLIRLAVDFVAFTSESADIVRRCNEALKNSEITECDALSIMHDYQTARHSAPLLPTFIWKWYGGHLREQWRQFRQASPW